MERFSPSKKNENTSDKVELTMLAVDSNKARQRCNKNN
jgi:hypothetical protein